MNIVLERQVWEEVDIFMYLEALVFVVVACPRLHARLATPLYARAVLECWRTSNFRLQVYSRHPHSYLSAGGQYTGPAVLYIALG